MNTICLVNVIGMGLYSWEAYCELRLQMSTGDFHSHKHEIQTCDASVAYNDIDDDGEFYVINDMRED